MAPPRKHSTLTIKDKLRIIEMLDKGDSYPVIARKFGIGRSTVGDIKKNKDKLLKFVSLTERGPGVRKTLKKSENPVLEDALFTWFLQQRGLEFLHCYCWIIVLGIHQQMNLSLKTATFLQCSCHLTPRNVLQNVKLNYRKSLLVNCLALCSENLMDSLKSITLKDTVFLLANCWANVKTSLINKSWKNLHPEFLTDNDEPEDDVPLAQLFNRLRGPNDPQISEAEAEVWAAGGAESELQRYEVLTEEEIVRAAMCEDDEEDEDNSVEILKITKVGKSEAVGALNTA
ncbi:unnamed protein product [Arctia plantaginis]|uniref:HTH psq-type domain-containing protein n=1 Tax=Arctia plantaginis TaxID=874455 RepID=A0A8S1AXZ7_ARCPL|nr:unnamed protein product [Arctia plantaginis]